MSIEAKTPFKFTTTGEERVQIVTFFRKPYWLPDATINLFSQHHLNVLLFKPKQSWIYLVSSMFSTNLAFSMKIKEIEESQGSTCLCVSMVETSLLCYCRSGLDLFSKPGRGNVFLKFTEGHLPTGRRMQIKKLKNFLLYIIMLHYTAH